MKSTKIKTRDRATGDKYKMTMVQGIKAVRKDNAFVAKFEQDELFRRYVRFASRKKHGERGSFKHALSFVASEQFVLQEFIPQSGPHAGHIAFAIVRAKPFPFDRLPIELRQQVYKLVFLPSRSIAISREHIIRRRLWHDPSPSSCRKYALLLVSRAIGEEAKEFFYCPYHFTFRGVNDLIHFLRMIGSGRKYLTHLTLSRSGYQQIEECYLYLRDATRFLRYFKIILPASPKAPLAHHIDMQWKGLSPYLLAHKADYQETLRRLGNIHFDIAYLMKGILDSDRQPIKEMTKERQEWCKARIREHLSEHFANKRLTRATTPEPSSHSKARVIEIEN